MTPFHVWRLSYVFTVAAALSLGSAAGQDVSGLEEQAIKAAAAKAAPSVVRIETFGGLEKVGRMLVGTGPTTGVVVAEDGYVISSAFNFVQLPSSILVTLPSGKRAAAEIVSRDTNRMLVLLKVHTEEKLVVPEFVPKSEMAVGQWSIALGRTFEGDQPNISVGVISALSRIWGKAIQTDAKVSPSNYGGPVVDIRGRVQGILVPLSPQGGSELAGAEWYDSGIGFAIPLSEILPHLEKMQQGEALKAGLLGVSLKGSDIYSNPAEIAACQPKSPAYEAGLKTGDRIIEVDGVPIVRQSQLKHALGPRYAGDRVRLVYMRGEDRREATVELTDKLEPYQHPFVGILPMRTAKEQGEIIVRYVYPDSPAAAAGLKPGDALLKIGGDRVASVEEAWQALASMEPGAAVSIVARQGDVEKEIEVVLAALPDSIPDSLPAAREPVGPSEQARPAVGEIDLQIPEESHHCLVYVPEAYRPEVAYGVIVWLHEPGGFDRKKAIERWKPLCDGNDLILIAPQADNPQRWMPTEAPFVRKTIGQVMSTYHVDAARIVAHGYQAGGAMAYLTGLTNRDVIRAVSAVDAAVPARISIQPNDPIQRLAFYSMFAKESKMAARIQAAAKALEAMKFPVILNQVEGEARDMTPEELSTLVRWIDTLDRI